MKGFQMFIKNYLPLLQPGQRNIQAITFSASWEPKHYTDYDDNNSASINTPH